jgi:hypothetical protein
MGMIQIIDIDQLQMEFDGQYKVIFNELHRLEREYPDALKNHDQLPSAADDEILLNTYAALLYPSANEKDPTVTPRIMRECLQTLSKVDGGRLAMLEMVQRLYAVCVFLIEHLYFRNRWIIRHVKANLPAGTPLEQWAYPQDQIDKLRDTVREIWMDHVSSSS